MGIWRTRADADIYLLDPVKDPAVAGQKGGWRQVVRDMLTGATTEWATVIDGVYPVALDDDFWADVDNGHPLAGI